MPTQLRFNKNLNLVPINQPFIFLVVQSSPPASTIPYIDLSSRYYFVNGERTSLRIPSSEQIDPDNRQSGFLFLWKVTPDIPFFSLLKSNNRFYQFVFDGALGRLNGCYMSVFEHGVVYGGSWKVLIKGFKSYSRKLGSWLNLVPLDPDFYLNIRLSSPFFDLYSYNGTGNRAHSYAVRSAIKQRLPKKYKRLYRLARNSVTLYLAPDGKIVRGLSARRSGFPVHQSKTDFFFSCLTDDDHNFLNSSFGSWKFFYLIVSNPLKFPLHQSQLHSFLRK